MANLEERLWAKIDRRGPDECWPWLGTMSKGYGVITVKKPSGAFTSARVHRVVYELLREPIAEGLQADHTCHSRDSTCTMGDVCPHRACCNPAHIELVTAEVNIRRAHRTKPTHCPKGHPYDINNTLKGSRGSLKCRECHRAQSYARYTRRQPV